MFEGGGHGPAEFCRVLTIVSVAIEALTLHARARLPMIRLPGPVFDDCTQCLVSQGERTPSFGGCVFILDVFLLGVFISVNVFVGSALFMEMFLRCYFGKCF